MPKKPTKHAPKRPAARAVAPVRKPAAVAAPATREKRPMTPADKYFLELYARKIPLVEAWPPSDDRTATLERLKALHGDLLDQVLAEPVAAPAPAAAVVAPELVPEPAPAPVPEPAAAAAPAPPANRGVDFRGNPLPA